jgi:amidase
MKNHTESDSRQRRTRRCVPPALVAGLALSTLVAVPADALNTVTVARGDTWQVQDAAIPGVDTGSVTRTNGLALQGYGGLRVEVDGGTSRLNGILLRGFGMTYDGRDTFSTTQGVKLDGVVVERELKIDKVDNYGRFFDSFTNTLHAPVTVDVAFGGQLGYNTGVNQTAIAGSSSGDAAIAPTDSWASWYSPSAGAGSASHNGPSATVAGEPGTAGAITRMGNFLRDPFANDMASAGDEANHPAFMTELTIQPGQTASLLRYVIAGRSEVRGLGGNPVPAAGSEVDLVEAGATALAATPDLSDLRTGEICSVVNFAPATLGITDPATCAAAATEPIQNDVIGAVQAETVKTTSTYDPLGKSFTEQLADLDAERTNSQQIVRAYLDRIAAYDRGPFGLKSVLSVAPDAMQQARAADAARKAGDTRPLLGVPIVVKDIIDTKDMPTTGGSILFDGWTPPDDSFQVKQLRKAGAIILGKTNLSRFAWSGHFSQSDFGQVWNAFDPSRSTIGSSGGSGASIAASFSAAAMGTQTGDSLWGPAWAGSLYSLRGTDGMQSSAGTMPLAIIQDYVGFMTQSVEDLAALLEVAAVDNPDDVLDDVANGNRPASWTEYFTPTALQGKVIGVPAGAFNDPFGTTETSDALRAQFATFEAAGATVKEIPAAPAAPVQPAGLGSVWSEGIYEGWEQWFEAHPDAPTTIDRVQSGTSGWTESQQREFEAWRARYRDVLATWMDDNGVDAVLYPEGLSDIHLNDSTGNSFGRRDPQSSDAGVPTAIFPAGMNSHGTPIGFQLQGKAFQDAELLGFVYAFKTVREGRALPAVLPALEYDADAIPSSVEPLEPLQPGAPPAAPTNAAPSNPVAGSGTATEAVRRPTVLSKRATVRIKANGPAAAVLRLGCASSGEACTSTVQVKIRGKVVDTKTVRVRAGAQKQGAFKLPAKAKRKLLRGKKVVLRVTFAGTGGTQSVTRAIKVTVRR